MKLLVGTAAYRYVSAHTAASMLRLAMLFPSPRNFELLGASIIEGYGACRNVEQLCDAAVEIGADAVLYHDSDMIYGPDDVEAMVALHGAASASRDPLHVIAAQYRSSHDAMTLVGSPMHGGAEVEAETPRGVCNAWEAKRIGFGLVLIPVALLKVLDKPWMREDWDGFEMRTPDTTFGERAQAHGATLWLTTAAGGVKHRVTQVMGL